MLSRPDEVTLLSCTSFFLPVVASELDMIPRPHSGAKGGKEVRCSKT